MNRKYLWIDLETSSLSPRRGVILQISAIATHAWEEIAHFNFYMRHNNYGPDYQDTIKIHNLKPDFLKSRGQEPQKIAKAFIAWLHKYYAQEINYKNMKIILAGKSINFDKYFLLYWLGKETFEKYFHYHSLDLTSVIFFAQDIELLNQGGVSLSTAVKDFNSKYQAAGKPHEITLEQHNAASDIAATWKLYRELATYAIQ